MLSDIGLLSRVNGQRGDTVSVQDRGISYADGVFETIPIMQGKPRLWTAHMQRLLDGCQCLQLPTEGLVERFEQDLSSLLDQAAGRFERAVLKLMVTRGTGPRGYAPPSHPQTTTISTLYAGNTWPEHAAHGIEVRRCHIRLARQPALAGIKHLNRLEQVLARAEWQSSTIAEGLMCDSDDWLIEGTMSNLFMVRDLQLHTPLLDQCGVAGIIRNTLLERARQSGIEVFEGEYRWHDLLQSEEVFICNSLIDIWPVTRWEQHTWPVGPLTRQLQALLAEEYQQ